MLQRMKWGAIALLGMLAISCAPTSQLMESWVDPTYQPQPVKKVMVVGLGDSDRRMMLFEDIMASHVGERKVEVVKGTSLKVASSADVDAFKQKVKDSGADLVTITRLVGEENETVYHPGSTTYVPVAGYYGMGSYYGSAYGVVHDPGYVDQYKVFKVETNVYDVKSEKLVWSGLSHTTDPSNFDEGVNSLAQVVVEGLVKHKVLP